MFLVSGLGKRLRPEAVEQKIPARCAATSGRVASAPADPPDPDASEHPFVVDAGPERAGPTDEGGAECSRITRIGVIGFNPR